MDPVRKFWQSDYATLSNNPIWKLDPKGDDDFFNAKGEFIRSSGSGTQIRIEGVPGIKKLTDINFKNGMSLLSKVVLSSNILTYYSKQLGIQGIVLPGVYDGSDAFTVGEQLHLSVNRTTGTFYSNDYNSIENTLIHEKGHQDNYIEKEKKNQQNKEITFQEHTEIYINQFKHFSFGGMSQTDRIGRVSSAVDYALNSIARKVDGSDRRNNLTGVYDIIEDINKVVAKYHIDIVLNDNKDVTKGYKIIDQKGTRSYQYQSKVNAN